MSFHSFEILIAFIYLKYYSDVTKVSLKNKLINIISAFVPNEKIFN